MPRRQCCLEFETDGEYSDRRMEVKFKPPLVKFKPNVAKKLPPDPANIPTDLCRDFRCIAVRRNKESDCKLVNKIIRRLASRVAYNCVFEQQDWASEAIIAPISHFISRRRGKKLGCLQ